MKDYNFETLKIQLYKEVLTYEKDEDITSEFRKNFLKLIELCTFSLMNGEDNFFALFMIEMKRELKLKMAAALATRVSLSYFTIYFNPYIFLSCTIDEMKALIKHEIYHIMYNHILRAEVLKRKYGNLAINTAMDISINQYIENLPLWSEKLQNVKMAYNVDLSEDLTLEEYAMKIQVAIDALKGGKERKIKVFNENKLIEKEHNTEHSHDLWTSSMDDFNFEQIKELIKRTVASASKGKMPKNIEKFINALNTKEEITWQDYLRSAMGKLPVGYKKTITRKDRRQPNRLDLRGKLSDHVVQIVIALDISGSITDDEINKIMVEIFAIIKNYKHEIIILECDSEVRRAYKVKTKRDLKSKIDTKGATYFSPVFEYIHKHNMKDYLLIYFTDGFGEEELTVRPSNFKTLWILTGKNNKLSLKNSYGTVKVLSKTTEKIETKFATLKDYFAEVRSEWAK